MFMRRLLVSLAGVLIATTLHAMPAVQGEMKQGEKAGEKSGKTMTASGTVSAVSGSSLTVKTGKEDMTFTVDEKTKITASGASTKSKEKKAAGEKTVITDFVGDGDTVRVTYHDTGGTKHAASVAVTRKAAGKK
jgi:hypothetical protein